MSVSAGRTLADFSYRLRQAGLDVGIDDTLQAGRALTRIDLSHRDEVYRALRCVLVRSVEDQPLFDQVFAAFWGTGTTGPRVEITATETDRLVPEAESSMPLPGAERGRQGVIADQADTDSAREAAGGAWHGPARDRDIAGCTPGEKTALLQLARRAGHRLARAQARRWHAGSGTRLDWPRLLRRAARHDGEILRLAYRHRPRHRLRLFVLADVSRSMREYSRLALFFVEAFGQIYRSVHVAAFAETLLCVGSAARALSARPGHGGTRIGNGIEAALATPAGRRIDPDTVVLVLSDGWDAGPRSVCVRSVARLARRAHAVHWLDPLQDHPDYFASAAGIHHDLAGIDRIWPARSLADLEAGIARLPVR